MLEVDLCLKVELISSTDFFSGRECLTSHTAAMPRDEDAQDRGINVAVVIENVQLFLEELR